MTVFKTSRKQNKKKPEVFKFQVSGSDETFELPLMQYLPADLAQRLKASALRMRGMYAQYKSGSLDEENLDVDRLVEVNDITREIFDLYAPGALSACDEAELGEVMAGWRDASDVSVGESSASSSS